MGKRANSFGNNPAQLILSYETKTFNGSLEILSGKKRGTWGIQDWKTYQIDSDGNTIEKENKDMKFWIPTYQYFIEFPKRIQEANAIDYIGTKTINGVEAEGVIASWNTVDPQKDIDQYLIWIDAKTKQIIKIEYTVREMYKFITGAASFESYKSFDGIPIPTQFPVESNLSKNIIHKMFIKDFKANNISLSSLKNLEKSVNSKKE